MQQTRIKEVRDKAWLGGKGDPLGIVQENEVCQYYQIRISPKNEVHKILCDFEIQTGHLMQTWKQD